MKNLKVGSIVAQINSGPSAALMVVTHQVGDRFACGSSEAWGWLYAESELEEVKDVSAWLKRYKAVTGAA